MATIFEILVRESILNPNTQDLLQMYCEKWQVTPYRALLETHILTEAELANYLAQIFKIDRIYQIEVHESFTEAKKIFDYALASRYEAYPRKWSKELGLLELVITDPSTPEAQSGYKNIVSCQVKFAISERSEILQAIDRDFPMEDQLNFL